MPKLIRLGPSGIEYLTHVWNFYSGCHHKQQGICKVAKCWAEQRTNRHKAFYPNGFEPTFYPKAFLSPLYLRKPARIGVCFMGDLFGDWVNADMDSGYVLAPGLPINLKGLIYHVIEDCPQHTFVFLTKNPSGLKAWSPFPRNCWVGMSATDKLQYADALYCLGKIGAKVHFISLEPLLKWDDTLPKANGEKMLDSLIDWVIIGAQTKPYRPPAKIWIDEITEACRRASIPYFQKNNLKALLGHNLIQELPE